MLESMFTSCNILCFQKRKNLDEVLPSIVDKGIDCIEFHAMGLNEEEIASKWKYIK